MRVVWITHNYPRHSGDVSGAFLHPLAVALRSRGVDVRVIAPSDSGRGGQAELDGVPVHRVRYGTGADENLAYHGTMTSVIRSPRGLLAFRRLQRAMNGAAVAELAGSSGAIVHAHWWIPAGRAAPASTPLVLTCHGTDVRLLEKSRIAARMALPVFRRARVVTTVSRSLADTIAARTGVTVGPDAIQPMPVVDVERPWSDYSGDVVIVGRLSVQKRIDLALEAFAIARRDGLMRGLTVAGDGPARAALELLATRLGLAGHVTFVGQVAPLDVPRVFATAACCLMPAHDEGFGLAAAEALMQGVPVIACTDGGGVREIVADGGAGRIVAPDAGDVAAALADIVDNATARAVAREAGSHWRTRLAPDAVADRCLEWYARAAHA